MAKKEENKKAKMPTPQKRDLQNQKKQMVNKIFKSRVRTAMRSFESAVSAKNAEQMQEALKGVFSMMDRGVKRGVFTRNKADRTKARAMKKTSSVA